MKVLFPEPDGPHDHHHLAAPDPQVDPAQGMKTVGIPLLNADRLDHPGPRRRWSLR